MSNKQEESILIHRLDQSASLEVVKFESGGVCFVVDDKETTWNQVTISKEEAEGLIAFLTKEKP